jgi:hypothetical protein
MAGGDVRHQRALVEAGALRGLQRLIEHGDDVEGHAYRDNALLAVARLIDGRDAEVLQALRAAGLLRLLLRPAVFRAKIDDAARGAVLRLASTGPDALARCVADSGLPQLLRLVLERNTPSVGAALAAIDRVLRLEGAMSGPVPTAARPPPPRKRGRSDAAPTLVPTSGDNVFAHALVQHGVVARVSALRDGGGPYASEARDLVATFFRELPQ